MFKYTSLISLVFMASSGFADTIYIQPGQCVMVGSQQICAQKENETPREHHKKDKTITTSTCKHGAPDESDSKLTGYGHYLIRIKEDGSKTETLVKSYGPAGKVDCERDAKNFSTNP